MNFTWIDDIERLTGLNVYPMGTDKKEECILYEFANEADNGIISQDRLSLRIITEDIPTGIEAIDTVKQILVTVGDIPKDDYDILKCSVNGGGSMSLRDETTHYVHNILYLTVLSRSKVEI